MKLRCQFQGGAGLPEEYREKYRPALPCLGEFERANPREKNCNNCKPVARLWQQLQGQLARYRANPKKAAKRARKNRWARAKAAGRAIHRIGERSRCKYRDRDGKRGEGCLGIFERQSSSQNFCEVCQKHADADRAQKYRDDHRDELLPMYRAKGKRLRQLASRGKILDEVKNPESIKREMMAIYLKLHPEASSNGDVREIFGPVSDATIRRARTLAKIAPPKGRPSGKARKAVTAVFCSGKTRQPFPQSRVQ